MLILRDSIFAALTVAAMTTFASAGTLVQWNFNSVVPDATSTTGSLLPSTNNSVGLPTVGGVGLGTSTKPAPSSPNTSFTSGTTFSTISFPLDNSSDPNTSDNSALLTHNYPDQGVGSDTAGIVISVSSLGFQNLSLTWDQKTDSAASKNYRVRYSTDGQNFTSVGPLFQPATTNFWDANHPFNGGTGTPAGSNTTQWSNGNSLDLSGIAALNDQVKIYLEIVSEFNPANGTQYQNNNSPSNIYAPTNANVRFDDITISASPTPEPATLGLIGVSTILLYRRRATGK